MNIKSGAYVFRNLHKITNQMEHNLFGHNLIPRYMLTAPDYTRSYRYYTPAIDEKAQLLIIEQFITYSSLIPKLGYSLP